MPNDATSTYRALSALVAPVDAKITHRKDQTKPYIGLEHIPSRGAHLTDWALASTSISTNAIFRAGDVLFGKLRPNLRKCVVAPFDGYCSTDILVLRANESTDPSFAGKVLRSELVGTAAEMTSVGTKMPRTSWKHLSTLEVFCPNLHEQSKIAQILDTLDTAIHETAAIVAKLQAVKQGLLYDLLTRGIDANGELRPPHAEAPHLYKPSPLGWVPKEWATPLNRELLTGIEAGWSPSCPEEPPSAGEWGVLKVSAVSSGTFDPQESKRLPSNLKPIPSIEVKVGDVLLARANGVAELVATTVLVREAPSRLMLSDKTLRLVPDEDRLIAGHLVRAMAHYSTRKQINGMLNGSSGQRNISQEQIRNLCIPVPPTSEQRIGEDRATQIEERIAAESQILQKLTALKAGLMEDLLNGQVRVTPLLADGE